MHRHASGDALDDANSSRYVIQGKHFYSPLIPRVSLSSSPQALVSEG